MIRMLKTQFGLNIKSHAASIGEAYRACGKKVKKDKNEENVYYLAARLSKTLLYLNKHFDYDYNKGFTWVLRDSAFEGAYGISTHPNEKVKVIILSMALGNKKLTTWLSNTQHVYDSEYHIVAERSMDQYTNKTSRQNAFTDAIIRHEIGHILTKSSDVKKVRKWMKIHSKKWWRENVSEYALKDAYEATAELFSLITEKTYEFGTLPRKMEALVLNMTSRP